MAEATKTYAELAALFADNTTGDISPEDLRCLLISTLGEFAHMYMTGNGTTYTMTAAFALFNVGTFTAGEAYGCSVDTATRKITVDKDGHYLITLAMTCANNNANDVEFKIYKNGTTPLSGAYAIQRMVVSSVKEVIVLSTIALLSAGEYLQLFVKGTASDTFLIAEYSLSVKRIR